VNLGLRVGEALALEWEDIDCENKIIRINKTVQSNIMNFGLTNGNNTTYNRIKKSTKTNSGVRVLQLNDSVLMYIKELQEYDKRNEISSKYVSCTNVGTLNSSRNLQRSLDRIIKRSGIDKHVTLHTLRHTFGSTLLRNKVGIEVVSKLMGHANITITYNKYIHSIQEEEAKAMNMIKVC
jgi:integrase